ncbi:MAG: thiaminase II [Acidobacteriales bacterium]|nr:thiaminase II [Terriglobales bacterium]
MRILLLVLLAWPCLAEDGFTTELWSSAGRIYARTLEHPFLKGLSDGTLPRERFRCYLLQDARYLRAYSQALNILAAKAPREEWAITLGTHAVDALRTERQLHESILHSYGVSDQEMRSAVMAPSNVSYTNHLLAAVHQRPFGEALAAMLPCYWIYWEVGKELRKRGSSDPNYRRWIEQYSDPAYGKAVEQVLAMMNEEARTISPQSRARAVELFKLGARYEYMFWDMAWRQEQWVP